MDFDALVAAQSGLGTAAVIVMDKSVSVQPCNAFKIPIPSPYHPHTIPIPSPYHPHTIPMHVLRLLVRYIMDLYTAVCDTLDNLITENFG